MLVKPLSLLSLDLFRTSMGKSESQRKLSETSGIHYYLFDFCKMLKIVCILTNDRVSFSLGKSKITKRLLINYWLVKEFLSNL